MDIQDTIASISNTEDNQEDDTKVEKKSIERLIEVVKGIPPPVPKYEQVKESRISILKAQISVELETHLNKIGYTTVEDGIAELCNIKKDKLRGLQKAKRQEQLIRKCSFIIKKAEHLLEFIADGSEVDPEKIEPVLRIVHSGTIDNDLFHFLSFYWSVPVSYGYGRRMRFLVLDKQNDKAMGIFGLTDPVFNLRARDNWIGWNVEQRRNSLRSVMDAYVLGAVPPYSGLLCGKLVCTLLTAEEVRDAYVSKYSSKESIIKKRSHDNNLLLLTTTSALGKSSLYDRIRIGNRTYFQSVGVTEGYGHFHIPQVIFNKMRHLLTLLDHPYAKNNRFGNGPNWRMRVIRVALKECGFNARLLKHQIKRESFMIPLAENTRACLKGEDGRPRYFEGNVKHISERAKERWIIPRSIRRPSYTGYRREEFLDQIVRMMTSK